MIQSSSWPRALVGAAASTVVVLGAGAPAQADPPGNNGTVKIAPHGEVDGIPQNTPHVGCRFDVEWYGFDEGEDIVSEVTFESWAPTRVPMAVDGPSRVHVGGDPASGAGRGTDADGGDADNGFDGEATYTLAFDGEPHAQQGFHVRLTIHTPGSRGADVKHKMFWVQDCAGTDAPDEEETPVSPDTPEEPVNPPAEPEQPDTPAEPEQPEQPAQPEAPEVADEQAEEPRSSTQVMVRGEQASAPPVAADADRTAPHQVDAGVAGAGLAAARTHLGVLAALAGLLLAAAGLLLRRARG